jgi:hypothetical protein
MLPPMPLCMPPRRAGDYLPRCYFFLPLPRAFSQDATPDISLRLTFSLFFLHSFSSPHCQTPRHCRHCCLRFHADASYIAAAAIALIFIIFATLLRFAYVY